MLDREQLVRSLATGSRSTNLWFRSEVDIFLSTRSGRGNGWDSVSLSLNSSHRRRVPAPEAEPFRELHRLITRLWTSVAGEIGAVFGRVEDEWSLEQIWSELPDPRSGDRPPPPGSWPDWLSWLTYFDADRYRLLPPLPAELDAYIRRTPEGAAVIALPTDPAAVDEARFARLHRKYRLCR